MDSVAVTRWDFDLANVDVNEFADDVVVLLLPDMLDGDSTTYLYRDGSAGLAKTVNAEGGVAKLAYLVGADRRAYLGEHGVLDEVLFNISLGVLGNFTADALKLITRTLWTRMRGTLGRGTGAQDDPNGTITVRIARFELERGRAVEGFEYTGPIGGVIQALEGLRLPNPSGDNEIE